MARTKLGVTARSASPPPAARLEALLAAATEVFQAQGYRRTQMAAVAEAAGVSPGALYNYVEGKDALFRLVLERSLGRRRDIDVLPVPSPALSSTIDWVHHRLDFSDFPILATATPAPGPDALAEIRAVLGELHNVLTTTADAVDLLEASATDLPALGATLDDARRDLVTRLATYLQARAVAGGIPAFHAPALVARMLVELTWWVVGDRRRDPDLASVPNEVARDELIAMLATGLVHDERKAT